MDILYIGGFRLPDKNAAAQRVIANAAALRELGHNVVFVNSNSECKDLTKTEYFGFECYDLPPQNIIASLFSLNFVQNLLSERKFGAVIAYNYPAVVLARLISYCKKNGIKCIADATEWYQPQGNPLYCLVKTLDTELRMRYLQFRMDGVIAISEYLYQYYHKRVPTVKIPPLVDLSQEKWKVLKKKDSHDRVDFVYCGTPSAQKECLDKIVNAIESLDTNENVCLSIIGITQAQYEKMYGVSYCGNRTDFLGRLSHEQSLQRIALSDWSIIIRENNKVVQAGFPTKLVESISVGKPIIINKFSNICDYIDNTNGIVIDDIGELSTAILKAEGMMIGVDQSLFDYKNYTSQFEELFSEKES